MSEARSFPSEFNAYLTLLLVGEKVSPRGDPFLGYKTLAELGERCSFLDSGEKIGWRNRRGKRERKRLYTRQDSRRGFREILKARLSLAVGKALSAADARKRKQAGRQAVRQVGR